jgi:catechol 2,3-dioxygenase-like lactoylglutathione lyase family enzyme
MVLVPDLDEAQRFYGEVLGFELRSGTDTMLEFDQAGAPFLVFRCEASAPKACHGETAASVFVFQVADIVTSMAELRAKGVAFLHQAPACNGLGRYAAFHAPGGLVHEIFQPNLNLG